MQFWLISREKMEAKSIARLATRRRNHGTATCSRRYYFYTPWWRGTARERSSFIPEGEAEHRRKSTFRIGNIWIITSVRHTGSGQQRYFIEIVNRYRGLAVASRHVGILYAVTTPVSSVIFPGRRRRFLSSQIPRLEITFSCGLLDRTIICPFDSEMKYKILFFPSLVHESQF